MYRLPYCYTILLFTIGIIIALIIIIAIVVVIIVVVAVISLKIRAQKPIQYGAKEKVELVEP